MEKNERQPSKEPHAVVESSLGRAALSIGVFCSARDLSEELTHPARELGRLVGERGHDLVWGGSDIGTMHVISHEAREAGARIIGVTTESLSRSQHKTADEMIVASTLSDRKMVLVEKSDALVVLAGGTGTLDEVADVIERKKFGHHYKPIVFLNSAGFYEGLKMQFDRMEEENMLNRPLSDIVNFVSTPEDAMELIEKMQAEHLRTILDTHGLTEQAKISGGHSGAALYRARNEDGERFVIKVSEDKISTKEIKSNTKAYKAIDEASLGDLIPDIQTGEDPAGRKYILMPDLGETMTSRARSEVGADYRTFLEEVEKIFIYTLQDNRRDHIGSIDDTKTMLKQFLASIKLSGIADQDILDATDRIDSERLSSDKASLFLLDFTPDNVFVHEGKVQFIDPWEQPTYKGSSIISLAQFQTLSSDVYDLPGAKDSEPLFERLFNLMGEKLELTNEQVEKQRMLGAALQFSLSSFTRINSDPDRAIKYYKKSYETIRKLVD